MVKLAGFGALIMHSKHINNLGRQMGGRRRGLAVLMAVALLTPALILALTSQSGTVAASPDTTTYDFNDNENNLAWSYAITGSDYTMDLTPSGVSGSATPADQSSYNAIENSDDTRWAISGVEGDEEEQYFRFKINENLNDIDNFKITWEGYGDTTQTNMAYVYVWNLSTSSWQQIAQNTSGEATFPWDNNAPVENFIDEDGHIWVAASSITESASCPIFYSWDGEKWVWAAEASPSGGLAFPSMTGEEGRQPSHPIDYIPFSSSQVGIENDSIYLLLREDQNEITYIDQVKLYGVIHPQDTKIYSATTVQVANPPPSGTVHTVKNPMPVKAWSVENEKLVDISLLVKNDDETWFNFIDEWCFLPKCSPEAYSQIILDLGDLKGSEQIKLLVKPRTLWAYEINKYPFAEIWKDGEWVKVAERIDSWPEASWMNARTYCIDITDWFDENTENYLIRINDWRIKAYDYIAVDTSKDKFELVEIPIKSWGSLEETDWLAVMTETGKFDPYTQAHLINRNVAGTFTKTGAIDNLLKDSDDMFAVMAPGDQIELEFEGIEFETYVLYTDTFYKEEWTKYLFGDDVNTSTPYPFHAMSYYPYPDNENFPWDNKHLDWQSEYQTRYVEPETMDHHTLYTDFIKVDVYYTSLPVYPTKPVLYSPDNNAITDNTPAFEWTNGVNADNHRLLVDNDSDFSSPEENQTLTTDNFYTIASENSLAEDNYSWKIGAINENGENWSAVWTFVVTNWATPIEIEYKCHEATGFDAENTIDNDISTYWKCDNVTAHGQEIWFDMGQAYTVQKIRLYQSSEVDYRWGQDDGFTVYVSTDNQNWGDNVWENTLYATGWQVATFAENKNGRYIRLVSKVSSIAQRMYEFDAYVAYVPPAKPVPFQPVDGQTTNSYDVKFEWIVGENAGNHTLQVDNDGDFSSPEIDVELGATDNYYVPTIALDNENYSWRVTASVGASENVSDVWTFIVDNSFIGYDLTGATSVAITNAIVGSKFGSGANTQIENLIVYINVLTAGKESNIKCAIYDENLNLVSQTDNLSITADGWHTFAFSAPPVLSENENYWFAAWDNGTTANVVNDNGYENHGVYWAETYSDNFPDTLRPPDSYHNWKVSIYAENFTLADPPTLPTQPVLDVPADGGNENTTETPTFAWSQSNGENYYRLLVDSSPPDWKDLVVWEELTDNSYVPAELDDDNYSWKVYAVNDNGRTESSTFTFLMSCDAHVSTENATNIATDTATLNAEISTYGKYDNVEARFEYRPYQSLIWGENWDISDHYYTIPTDPATTGDWGNRTPLITVAAYDSAEAGSADYNCSGENDHVEIQQAIDNAYNQGGGKVFLYDGHYYTQLTQGDNYAQIWVRGNVSVVGESKANTFVIDNAGAEPSARMFVLCGNNILIENITAVGQGSSIDREMTGVHINILTEEYSAQNIVVKNTKTENFAALGIYVEMSASGYPDNIWIINNEIDDTGNHGLAVTHATNVYVDNNRLINVGLGTPTKYDLGHGIVWLGTIGGAIVNNTIENAGWRGMEITAWDSGEPVTTENLVVQANLIVNGGRLIDNTQGIYIWGGAPVGEVQRIVENVIIRGNRFVDNIVENMKYGVYFYGNYVENCIVDNNNFVMVWEPIIESGTGHIIENNVGTYYETDWQTISSPTSTFSLGLENLQKNWRYQFRGVINTEDNELERGDVLYLQLVPSPEVSNVYAPAAVGVGENFIVDVELLHGDNVDRIENIWLKIYENTVSHDDPDYVENHYTFKWIRGENRFLEVGPDGTAPYDHLDNIDCIVGDNYVTVDNWTFEVKLANEATRGNWNIWVQVIDNANQENVEFVNKLIVRKWYQIENWTGTVEAPATWQLTETWTGTVQAPAEWQLVETWTGTVEALAAWQLIENWIGTVSAPVEWQLIETWTGTVEAPIAWQLVETWTGTVEAPATWQLVETWMGDIEAPVAWELIETWTGNLQHLLAVVTTESATDVGLTIATLNALIDHGSYENVDIRFRYRVLGAGTWENTAWEEDYAATLYSKVVTGLSSSTTYQFRGYIEYGSFENLGGIVEFTTQTEEPPTEQWYLMETWTGTIITEDVVRWRSAESWAGTIEASAAPSEPAPEEPGGPKPPPPDEGEPTPTTIPLEIGTVWSLIIAGCFIWLSAFKAGPRKRWWARNLIYVIATAAFLTMIYISSEGIVLSPITMVVGAWILIFVVAILHLTSIEAGSWRQRMTKQFFYVLITLTFLTLLYLGII